MKIPPKILEAAIPRVSDGNYSVIGLIIRDHDTANTTLICHKNFSEKSPIEERMLVPMEMDELMNPTKPCVQLNIQKVAKQIKESWVQKQTNREG